MYKRQGEQLFLATAVSNQGKFIDPHNDQLIRQTLTAPSTAQFLQAMYRWQDYLNKQLPTLLMPLPPTELVETISSLQIGTQPTTLAITPEDWYYTR